MNQELLKKLQLQAGGSFYPEVNPHLQEIFARLVMQECIEVIKQQESLPVGFLQSKPAHVHELAIKQHFGIAE